MDTILNVLGLGSGDVYIGFRIRLWFGLRQFDVDSVSPRLNYTTMIPRIASAISNVHVIYSTRN